MDVRIDGQRLAVAPAISRADGGQKPAARGSSESRGPARPSSPPASGASEPNGGAWFDANGDGVIESWSIAHGGDSFANFTPPPTGSAGSGTNTKRTADGSPATSKRDRAATSASTAAAMSHAHTAYQRDGLAHVPSGPAAGSGGAPAHPAPPAPRGGGVPLRSSAS